MPTRILIEGRPGAGKTTAVRRLASLVRAREVIGFTTEEIRQGGTRVGFALETFAGRRAVLAHADFPGPPRVGRYGVDTTVMERLALPALMAAPTGPAAARLALIDELGRMELTCVAFQDAVLSLFQEDIDIVATVHVHAHPFTDALKGRRDVDVVHITAANRDALPGELAQRLSRT